MKYVKYILVTLVFIGMMYLILNGYHFDISINWYK